MQRNEYCGQINQHLVSFYVHVRIDSLRQTKVIHLWNIKVIKVYKILLLSFIKINALMV